MLFILLLKLAPSLVAQEVHTDVHTAEEEAIEIIEAENTTEADQVVVKAEQEEETEEAEEELNNRLDSTMSVDDGVTQEEYKTTGLVIDTTPTKYVQEEVNITDSPLLEDGEEPTSAAIVATSFSSTISSILPPATPTSIHSNSNNDKSPTRQSLLRRETTKLNQKRKSLTKKLKQAIKNNGTTNKRNSV